VALTPRLDSTDLQQGYAAPTPNPKAVKKKKLEDRKSLEIDLLKARLELGSSSKRAELEPNLKLAKARERLKSQLVVIYDLPCLLRGPALLCARSNDHPAAPPCPLHELHCCM
jgi:hypothetical protein